MRNFRLVLDGIDPMPLVRQVMEHPELWNSDDAWTKGKPLLYATENIVLRYNKSSQPNLNDWDRTAFSILNAAQPIVFNVMRAIPGEHLGKVMISRLRPGEKIDWHIDYWPAVGAPYFQRYQIPLSVSAGVRFICGEEELYMPPGTAWWFDNQVKHAVFNDSAVDRLSMFVDIRPFKPLAL